MGGHLGIARVDVGLVAVGSRDTRAEIVGNDQADTAAEERERVDVGDDPVGNSCDGVASA